MRILTALAAAAVMAMPASAVTIFSQNFDTVPRANTTTNVPGFTVTGGTAIRLATWMMRCGSPRSTDGRCTCV